MILATTSTVLRVITSGTADIDVVADFVDADGATGTGDSQQTAITSATTTTVVSAPGSGVARSVLRVLVRNKHASSSNTVTVERYNGTIASECWKGTLAAGESVQYNGRVWLTDPVIAIGPQGPQGAAGPQGATGTDGWAYAVLGTDFNTTSATAVDVTGLSFTPSANKKYTVEGLFYLRTNTATVGPRPGCSWPTGLTDGVVRFDTPASATANAIAMGNFNAAVLAAVGGLPNTTQSYPGTMWGGLVAGASPSGSFQIQLATETAATAVYMKAGSFIRWREVV